MDTNVQVSNSAQIAQNQLLAVRSFVYEGRHLKLTSPKRCAYDSTGFEECHCNNCINAITEMDGIKKGEIYFLKEVNMNVVITSICPLRSCVDFGWERLPNATSGKLFGYCMRSDLD